MWHPFRDSKRRAFAHTLVSGLAGNVLEWYDFALYGFLAIIIATLFFPSDNQAVGLIATYGVFAAGFLMRPIGGAVFGYLGDTIGRKKVLRISIVMMTLPTFLLGVLPAYASVGIFAPILLIIIRLVQGLSVGGEFSTSVTYMVENAGPNLRGFAGSFSNIGSMMGTLLGSGIAALTVTFFPHDVLYSWGWRVPFLFGGILGIVALALQFRMQRSELPKHNDRKEKESPFKELVTGNKKEMGLGLLFTIGYAVFFYIGIVYLPTFANEFMGIPLKTALQWNAAATALSLLLIPFFGYLSDRILRRKYVLLSAFSLTAITAIPGFFLLGGGAFTAFLMIQFVLIILVSVPLGVAPTFLVELFPKSDRLTAYSITYNIALGIFGGTAPAIATWLLHTTGSAIAPGIYLAFVVALSVIALLFIRDRSREALR